MRSTGGPGNDLLHGEEGIDRIDGWLGDDRLFGGPGNDGFRPGVGNDRVFGGGDRDLINDNDDARGGPSGDDFYDGGAGWDTLSFFGPLPAAGVRLALGEDGATSRAEQGGEVDLVRKVEEVIGTLKADVLVGNDLANDLAGADGDDRLEGRGGNDVLSMRNSEFGSSTFLHGGPGDDRLVGGKGVDRLYAGIGADTVSAGEDFARDPRHGDFMDLGPDAQADTVIVGIDLSSDFSAYYSGFGIDRVLRFGAEDRLSVQIRPYPGGEGFVDVRATLDSNGDGRIDDADREVHLAGGDLVLDIDAAYQRSNGVTIGFGDQHVVLQHVTSFDADQLV